MTTGCLYDHLKQKFVRNVKCKNWGKNGLFEVSGPAVWAEQPFFSFAIIFYHPKEHSLRVSAFNSKFLSCTLLGSKFCVACLAAVLGPLAWFVNIFDPRVGTRVPASLIKIPYSAI